MAHGSKLTAQANEFVALLARQAVATPARVAVGLMHLARHRHRGGLELPRQLLGRALRKDGATIWRWNPGGSGGLVLGISGTPNINVRVSVQAGQLQLQF